MKYNFDEIIPRRNTDSVKWDLAQEDVLPMWVADMDFRTTPAVIDALEKRVRQSIFGYPLTPPAFHDAIQAWWQKRHHFTVNKDWIVPVPGILAALSAIMRAFTTPGDKVLLQSPAYNHFFTAIEDGGCEVVTNELLYEDGNYTLDYDDLEKKASDPGVKLLLLCNPHNPTGRAWTREELLRIGEICLRNDVLVLSDEIHSDLVFGEHTHVPFASLGAAFQSKSITCSSPSKTFNLAGLQVAYFICPEPGLKKQIEQTLHAQGILFLNTFATDALIAAYNDGEEWMEELKSYLYENYRYLCAFFAEHWPHFKVTPLEATYLVWVNVSALQRPSKEIADALLKQQQLWINPGTMYGASGEGFIRINIACPRELLVEGLERLKRYLA
jgi:cystathionine beta-lyase